MYKAHFKIILHRKICIQYILILVALFVCTSLYGVNPTFQNTEIKRIKSDITFNSLPKHFPYRATRSIIQDSKGFMWFGTENGLARFDGLNLKIYENELNNPTSIRHNTVNVVLEDKNSKLWVGTSHGLNIYNREHDSFFAIEEDTDAAALLNQSYVSSLAFSSDSLLWIGTFTYGLFCINVNTGKLERFRLDLEDGSGVNITCICADTNNRIWAGTQSGLALFNPENGKTVWHSHEKTNTHSLSSNYIKTIQKDRYGSIWIGTQDCGLNLLVETADSVRFERMIFSSAKVPVSSNAINCLLADDDGYMWIGTENDGLLRLHIQSGLVEVYINEIGNSSSIASNSIWSLYQDNEGRIWTGSYNKGISVYDAYHSKFEGFQINPYSAMGLPNNDVRGFCENDAGEMWIATDGGGICRFNIQTRTFSKFVQDDNTWNSLTNNSVQSIVCDNKGKIWLGSWGGGIDCLEKDGTFIKNYKVETENGVGDNKIRTIYRDKKDNIWAGSNGSGLFLFDKYSERFVQFLHKDFLNERSYISAIQSNTNNELWIGTLDGLVWLKLNEKNQVLQAKTYNVENSSISVDAINCLFIDSSKQIWIGTTNGGLNIFETQNETFKVLRVDDGLPSNNISGILEDNNGCIWISTNAGIAKIRKDNDEITNFTTQDGLNSNVFYSKSIYKTQNGILLFGSNKGFNLINAQNIKYNELQPNVVLSNLYINNKLVSIRDLESPLKKQLSETDTIVLSHVQSSFSIDFVALSFTRPEQNQYAYMLEGYDDEWNFIGNKTSAYYTKVRHGEYIFKVKAANNDQVWNNEPNILHIIIKPPFWKTKWAYIAYLLLFFIIMTIILWTWQERVHVNNQLKLEKLAKQKEHELNQRNLDFFTNISHEFRTPLSLIIGPVESMFESAPKKMHEQLRVIQRNSSRLLALTNNLLELRKLEDGGMGLNAAKTDIVQSTEAVIKHFQIQIKKLEIQFAINYTESEMVFYFDNEKYTTILFNLLSNAIKHTPEKGTIKIFVNYNAEDQKINVSVSNTGYGIQPSELPYLFDKFYQASFNRSKRQFGTGIGLTLSKGLVELLGGKIWVESTPGKETTFTFTFPVKQTNDEACVESSVIENVVHAGFLVEDFESEEHDDSTPESSDSLPLVLIVEDNDDLRNFLKVELARFYTVLLAKNGEEGLQMANETIPDLIISDIVMPLMDGIELCKAVKSDVKTSHIPVILLTAKTTTNERIEGFGSGADAYIAKPFHLKLLQTQIAGLIQSRQELYSRFSQDVYIMSRKQTGNDVDQHFLQSTIDYILSNLTDTKLNIDSLSAHHNMSHRNYCRKIKALTGNTVVEFIKIVRLKEALKLMEKQQYSLSEISYMTGFASPSYFTKNFREYYGKPPSEYLKS